MNQEYVDITTSCMRCGEMAALKELAWMVEIFKRNGQQFPYLCPKCEAERDAEKKRQEEEDDARYAESIDSDLEEAGVPQNYRLETPPVPKVAEFLQRHIDENILLSAPSGAGKSTSAGYLARKLILDGKKVRYMTLSELLDEWREARCSDYPMSVKNFLSYLEWRDVLIVDEAADKTVSTASAQECMFRLLEDVTNGVCKARLWLLGNYYKGAIEDVFGNGEAARRRLNEKFYCAIMRDNQIKHIKL